MRTISKIVLVIIIITLVYSVVKLIDTSVPQEQTIATITWPANQTTNISQNSQEKPVTTVTNNTATQTANQNNVKQSVQTTYQADEVLIDGQGIAGENYIDITSDTPITPQQIARVKDTQNMRDNSTGTYAEASISINNNGTNTTAQKYAPGMPAFEVIDGN